MITNDKVALEIIKMVFDAVCSTRWSLVHWKVKRVFGKEMASQIASEALPRTRRFREHIWEYIKSLSPLEKEELVRSHFSKKACHRYLRQQKKRLLPRILESRNDIFFKELSATLLDYFNNASDVSAEDYTPIIELLYPELQCTLETLNAEPWRTEKAFPIDVLNSPREEQRLRNEFSRAADYRTQLVSILWQLGANPYSFDLPARRKNDLLYQKVKQASTDNVNGKQVAEALMELFQVLSEESTARELLDHEMARILRHEFSLSRARKTETFEDIDESEKTKKRQHDKEPLEPWQPEDTNSMRGYEEVDYRLEYEALHSQLPPKQREAIDVYYQHCKTGESIEQICASRGLTPVVVRNNFRAIKNKALKLNI